MKLFKLRPLHYVIAILFVIIVPLFSYNIVYGLSSSNSLSTSDNTSAPGSGGDYYQYPRPSIQSPVSGQTISGNIKIETYSPGANWVKCKAWDKQNNALIKESEAIRGDDSGKWYNFWDTNAVHNGSYYIMAYSYFPNATSSYSDRVILNVANNSTTPGDTTTPSDNTSSNPDSSPVSDSRSDGSQNNASVPASTSQNNTSTSSDQIQTQENLKESIAYQKLPELAKAPISKNLKIDEAKVSMIDSEKGKVVLRGKAAPNTELFLYIFSDPIVVSVKTDNEGNWSYTLDDPIESGEHEVYVALKNEKGEISERSEAFNFFVGQAEAAAENDNKKEQSASAQSNNYLLYFLLAVVFLVVLVVSGVLLWRIKKRSKLQS